MNKFWDNPRALLWLLLAYIVLAASFVWNLWEALMAGYWAAAVVMAAVALLCLVGGGSVVGRLERLVPALAPKPKARQKNEDDEEWA